MGRRRAARIEIFLVCAPLFGCPPTVATQDGEPSTSTTDAGPTCDQLRGKYAFEYTRRSGDCDDHEETLLGLEQQLQFDSEELRFSDGQSVPLQQCIHESVKMSDVCTVTVDRTCALKPPLSGSYTVAGTLSIDDEDALEGALSFTVSSLGVTCRDIYDVKGKRAD